MRFTVLQIADRLRSEADAYKFLEELRWPDGNPTCPHCSGVGADYIRPLNGVSRRTRTGAPTEPRIWRCWSCRKQFSVISGTVFHGTRAPLRLWVLVIFEMCANKNGISAREVERKYGVCPRTAWFMLHRIREAMKNDGLVATMRGTVVADETWIGGDPKNRHRSVRNRALTEQEWAATRKVPVLSLIDCTTGEARSRVVPDVTGHTLRKVIAEQVDMAATHLHTDESTSYRAFGDEFAAHHMVNHSEDEYVRYEGSEMITSNQAENFFSQLKRSLDGTHHHVSREHLPRYLAEFDYRYSTKELTDSHRMRSLMGRIGGRRLTYKRVTSAN